MCLFFFSLGRRLSFYGLFLATDFFISLILFILKNKINYPYLILQLMKGSFYYQGKKKKEIKMVTIPNSHLSKRESYANCSSVSQDQHKTMRLLEQLSTRWLLSRDKLDIVQTSMLLIKCAKHVMKTKKKNKE